MKEEGYFINVALDKAIKDYISSSKTQDGILYNSFLVVTIRILALIYGKLDILNPYYLNNSVVFFNNLSKYGMSQIDIALFKEELLSYYEFENINNERNIKIKNPYFKTTLEYLIDMFVKKQKSTEVSYTEEEKFLELIYSTHTKNPYRISYGYLMLESDLYSEKYYYSKLNEIEMTKDLSKTINASLNLEALKAAGINLSNLESMSTEEIIAAQNNIYDYFEIDTSSLDREEKLQEKLNLYKMYGNKVTTGNGYVDILLLMSVIVTSISIISIIIFSII